MKYLNVVWNSLVVRSTALLLILHAGTATAQDQGNFTHFFINPYVLNASYAGLDGQASASLIFRKQWMTIDGAPTITNVSLHAPVNTRLGVGLNVNNDSKGFFNNSTLLLSLSYHLPLQDHSFIRFGLSAGGSWNTVDMDKLDGINDRALGNVLDNNASLAGNAGISFHHRTFNAGISLPSIFSPTYVSEDAFNVKEVKPFQAMIIHATNRFYFNNDKNIFEPYLLYHANTDLPSQFELTGIVHLNHLVWAGASYKQYFGISALGGLKLRNSLALGASYSISQSGVDELNSPSFEVSVNYLFGAHKRNAPVYSFVNAVKPRERGQAVASKKTMTWRQKQIEAEKQRREEAARVRAGQEEEKKQAAAEAKKTRSQAQAEGQQESVVQKREAENRPLQAQQLREDAPPTDKSTPSQTTEQPVQQVAAAEEPSVEQRPVVSREINTTNKPAQRQDNEQRGEEQRPRTEQSVKREDPIQPEQKTTEVLSVPDPGPGVEVEDKVATSKSVDEQRPVESERPVHDGEVVEVVKIADAEPVSLQVVQNSTPQNVVEPVGAQGADRTSKAKPAPQTEEVQGQDAVEEPRDVVEEPGTAPVRHEVFRRGNHPQELVASEYVVAGAFKSIGNATHFAEGLTNLSFDAQVGYLTSNGLWYVYLLKTDDMAKARAEHQRLSNIFLLRDAWLLTVEP